MRIKHIVILLSFVTIILEQSSYAQTITINQTGAQGDYRYEYWKDGGTGTMTLGDSGDFSCSWNTDNNILFLKGMRPGVTSQQITYSAVFNTSGNSYLGAYGWTKNPLVEYYIVDSWGSWKPPGGTSKGTVTSDGGVYDIYELNPRNKIAIGIMESYKQFWSIRQTKRTSGTITCANHFNAWAAKNMVMGDMYEVMFFIEGYQSSGNAIVTMSMTPGSTGIRDCSKFLKSSTARSGAYGICNQNVKAGRLQSLTFITPQNSYLSPKVYNLAGQEIASTPGKEYSAGKHSVIVNLNSQGKFLYRLTSHR